MAFIMIYCSNIPEVFTTYRPCMVCGTELAGYVAMTTFCDGRSLLFALCDVKCAPERGKKVSLCGR